MPVQLHESCKAQIKAALVENIPKVNVEYNKFPDRSSLAHLFAADGPIPKHGKQFDELQNYIGDYPFFEFIDGLLTDELFTRTFEDNSEKIPLNSLSGYENCEEVAERWISAFETLPWIYTLTIKFPPAISKLMSGITDDKKVSNSLHLVRPSDIFDGTFPSPASNGNLGLLSNLFALTEAGSPDKWDHDAVYAQIKVSGYIGRYGGTAPWSKAEDLLKSFCGLAIALRLFQVKPSYLQTPPKRDAIIHRKENASWIFTTRSELDRSISNVFNDLVAHDLEGVLDTEEKRADRFLRVLPDLQVVFSAQQKNEKILLASQWLFDSFSSQNSLLAFVQTMVALEILLGENSDRSDISLGELLRNRCAFLIGTSHDQRSTLLKDFEKIYRVRSQIVHRGKGRLTANEFGLFRQLQWICRRVIQEEVKLLKANE